MSASNEFKPSTWAQPAQDIAKEYNDWDKAQHAPEAIPDKPEGLSTSLVRRGIIDPNTGLSTGNSKQGKITMNNVMGFSEQGKRNYERIFGHP